MRKYAWPNTRDNWPNTITQKQKRPRVTFGFRYEDGTKAGEVVKTIRSRC